MSKLIKGKQKAKLVNPRVMVMFSRPKTGKTSLISALDNHFIFDFDGSSGYYDCNAVEVPDLATFVAVMKEIKTDGHRFKYILLDTITKALPTVIRGLAVTKYNQDEGESQPLNWNIESLSYGKGQLYMREAAKQLIEYVKPYCDYVIVCGHSADKAINKEGKDLTTQELDLSGKLKNILAAEVDALALLYRKEDNKNVLAFSHDDNVLAGTRSPHLDGQEFVISEKKDGVLHSYWDKIYI